MRIELYGNTIPDEERIMCDTVSELGDITAPTPEETETAVNQLRENNHDARGASVLEALARGVFAVVAELDRTHNVADYLKWMRIRCNGRNAFGQGVFHLDIEDGGTVIDREKMARQISEDIQQGIEDYNQEGRLYRRIELAFMSPERINDESEQPDAANDREPGSNAASAE